MAINPRVVVFVLNLKNSNARREHITNQLDKLNLDFRIVEAVNGRELSRKDLKNYSRLKTILANGRLLSRPEIGCAMSHFKIYQEIVDASIPIALILEDDATLDKKVPELLDVVSQSPSDLGSLAEGWDIINLGSDSPSRKLAEITGMQGLFISEFLEPANRASGYLLTQVAARTLLKVGIPIFHSADGLTGRWELTGLRVFGIQPNLVSTGEFTSTIALGGTITEKLGIISAYFFWNLRPKPIKKKVSQLKNWLLSRR